MLKYQNTKTYIDSIKEFNDKVSKFKVGDHVKISKYKNIFAKRYIPNWSKEIFVIKKLEIQFIGHMLLMISMMKKLLEHFMKKNYKKNQQGFRTGKVIKIKGSKLYVKWKGYNNLFNSWIDKNDAQ